MIFARCRAGDHFAKVDPIEARDGEYGGLYVPACASCQAAARLFYAARITPQNGLEVPVALRELRGEALGASEDVDKRARRAARRHRRMLNDADAESRRLERRVLELERRSAQPGSWWRRLLGL